VNSAMRLVLVFGQDRGRETRHDRCRLGYRIAARTANKVRAVPSAHAPRLKI
jgi:hypothetical protein